MAHAAVSERNVTLVSAFDDTRAAATRFLPPDLCLCRARGARRYLCSRMVRQSFAAARCRGAVCPGAAVGLSTVRGRRIR